mmetsp:Transcript_101541/g.295952  ORF Transcript_101541/g.295952 Transcript_101541/m.295952 type:complete len:283 (+) Transcript_101541:82-930(+)
MCSGPVDGRPAVHRALLQRVGGEQRARRGLPLQGWRAHGSGSLRIEAVVLQHENRVKNHGTEAEQQLYGVPADLAPIRLHPAVEQQLQHAEQPAREVEEHVVDVPARRALAPEVHPDLRAVLDDRDGQLRLGQHRDILKPSQALLVACPDDQCQAERRKHNCGRGAEDSHAKTALRSLQRWVVIEGYDLRKRHCCHQEGVAREEDVVEPDGAVASVRLLVLLLDMRIPEEQGVEQEVEAEAKQVQHRVVQGQAKYTSPLEVEHDLRIEGHAPGTEVRPSQHL